MPLFINRRFSQLYLNLFPSLFLLLRITKLHESPAPSSSLYLSILFSRQGVIHPKHYVKETPIAPYTPLSRYGKDDGISICFKGSL